MSARAPSIVLELVHGLDVRSNFAFLPHRRHLVDSSATPWLTMCNCYLTCCTAALGCAVPPKKANEQIEWLASPAGQLLGWMHVDSETARQRAQLGYPTVAGWKNSDPHGHGHVALCVPPPPGDSRIFVSAAGTENFESVDIGRSFGLNKAIQFFTHE